MGLILLRDVFWKQTISRYFAKNINWFGFSKITLMKGEKISSFDKEKLLGEWQSTVFPFCAVSKRLFESNWKLTTREI